MREGSAARKRRALWQSSAASMLLSGTATVAIGTAGTAGGCADGAAQASAAAVAAAAAKAGAGAKAAS